MNKKNEGRDMYKNKKTILLSFFLLLVAFSANAQEQLVVAVTPFELIGGFSQNEADVIYELFVTELGRTSGIRVVDRNSFDRILTQMRFQNTDWSDNNKVAQFGRALNANSIIRGQLMSLGSRLIISARIIDVNTTEILSGAPLQLNGIDELFGRMPAFVASVVQNIPQPHTYKIGDRGPGGGIVFFVNDGKHMEVSEELGSHNWERAKAVARSYQGGGFTDWRLPTQTESDSMYVNLKLKNLGNFANEVYWTSSVRNGISDSWLQNFNTGNQYYANQYNRDITYRVRAVRSF